jgi:DNA mismatch repair protein MutS
LFGAAAAAPPKTSAVEEALKDIEPDALTPKQALEILYEMKKKLPDK